MTKWVCRICILAVGLKGSDLHEWPDIDDEIGIIEHLKTAHDITVVDNPTPEQRDAWSAEKRRLSLL